MYNSQRLKLLQQFTLPLADYPWHSRCHELKSINQVGLRCYIKRDDELGLLSAGSKLRKYLSLIPALQAEGISDVILIGSAFSNHILHCTPLLLQNNMRPHLFLLGSQDMPLLGNMLFTKLMVSEKQINWIHRCDWPNVMRLANDYSQQLTGKVKIIPEGAFIPESLPGAMTLAIDILRNEQQLDLEFQHVFIDAGSGLLAIATLLAFAWLGKESWLHILLLADDEQTFTDKLAHMTPFFCQLVGAKVDAPQRFSLHRPQQARSFGATNQRLWQKIHYYARNEGLLLDPIYSAKLFMAMETIVQQDQLIGNCLGIHSGGSLSLTGFHKQLSQLCNV
jgi:1-aminocyclopropane-1-carboxylate deaminase